MKTYTYSLQVILFSLTLICHGTNSFSQKKQYSEPKVIEPGKSEKPPSDAIVLFNKGSLNNFVSNNGESPAAWKVRGKKFTVAPGLGSIQTKQNFGDCQLHIEWKTPAKDVRENKEGQACGNSGVYLMGQYEIQVLNSYNNKTYPDGQAGSIYGKYPPLVNASLKPDKWQIYDIIFIAPTYNKKGKLETPGYFTVFHNGVLIQNHKEIGQPTINVNDSHELYKKPLVLQDHENMVSYRNIWIRELYHTKSSG
jgi:hypothetical protein